MQLSAALVIIFIAPKKRCKEENYEKQLISCMLAYAMAVDLTCCLRRIFRYGFNSRQLHPLPERAIQDQQLHLLPEVPVWRMASLRSPMNADTLPTTGRSRPMPMISVQIADSDQYANGYDIMIAKNL